MQNLFTLLLGNAAISGLGRLRVMFEFAIYFKKEELKPLPADIAAGVFDRQWLDPCAALCSSNM